MTIVSSMPHLRPQESIVCWSIHVNLLFLGASDSLIQQTGCDLVTPGCQGESGGAMAVEATVGESQLQRIIRDLRGTPALCVCACSCECVWIGWLQAVAGLHCVTEGSGKKSQKGLPLCHDLRIVKSKYNLYTWNYLTSAHQIILENVRVTPHWSKGVVEASVSMQRDRKCVHFVHPSQVSFQLLRWIRGKWVDLQASCSSRRWKWKKKKWNRIRDVGSDFVWVGNQNAPGRWLLFRPCDFCFFFLLLPRPNIFNEELLFIPFFAENTFLRILFMYV